MYYIGILQPFVWILCVHRCTDEIFLLKSLEQKKGKQESVRQISPINFIKNACEILHTEYMFLLSEI